MAEPKPEKPQPPKSESAKSKSAKSQPAKSQPGGDSVWDPAILARIEAVIFSSDRPVSPARLIEGLIEAGASENPDGDSGDGTEPLDPAGIVRAVGALNREYAQSGRSFCIEQVAGGYRVMTLAEYAGVVGAFQKQRSSGKLSKPALETLAIVAYRQPVTRADLEAIRGVSCGEVLRSLLEKRLIAITGRAEVLGRPMLYGTTRAFLDAFGLSSIKDLPATGETGASGDLSQNLE